MKKILKIVNFICSNATTHRQPKNVLEGLDLEDRTSAIPYVPDVK
jgi:hypothetical protein